MSENPHHSLLSSDTSPVLLQYGVLPSRAETTWKEAAKRNGAEIIQTERFDECLLHATGTRPTCLVTHLESIPASSSQSAWLTNVSDPIFRRLTVVMLTKTAEEADQWGRIAWDSLPDCSAVDQVELTLAASLETTRLRLRDQKLLVDFHRYHAELIPEEVVVLNAVCAGKLNKQIAKELGVSIRTVEQRRRRVFEKMGVESAIPLAAQVATVQTLKNQGLRRDVAGTPSPPRVPPPAPHTDLHKKNPTSSPFPNAKDTKNDP